MKIDFLLIILTLTLSLSTIDDSTIVKKPYQNTRKTKQDRQTPKTKMKKQVIKKGKHFVRTFDRFLWPVNNEDFQLTGELSGPGIDYDHGSNDNLDWNKWAGCAFDLYQSHGQTVMVVWRKVQGTKTNEWGLYYHNIEKGTLNYSKVGSVPGLIDHTQLLSMPFGEVPRWVCKFGSNNELFLSLDDSRGKLIRDTVHFKSLGNSHTRINLYHGGNRRAEDEIVGEKLYVALKD